MADSVRSIILIVIVDYDHHGCGDYVPFPREGFQLGGAAITINPTHQHSKASSNFAKIYCFGHRLERGVAGRLLARFAAAFNPKAVGNSSKSAFSAVGNVVCS